MRNALVHSQERSCMKNVPYHKMRARAGHATTWTLENVDTRQRDKFLALGAATMRLETP